MRTALLKLVVDWESNPRQSICLGAVKKITCRWSSGHSFLEAGATLVAFSRSYLTDYIHHQWTKGHPERAETPPAAWTRKQRGIYLADALAKNHDIGSQPHSPIHNGLDLSVLSSFGKPPCNAESSTCVSLPHQPRLDL